MAKPKETLTFSPNTTACYICGKTIDQFKDFYGFSTHQQRIDSKKQSSVTDADEEIQRNYIEFVKYIRPKFSEFYTRLMTLPSPMDKLQSLTLISGRSRQQQQTFEQMFPEIKGFDYNELKTWGIGNFKIKGRGKSATLGEFKEFCKQVNEDFQNKVLNREIIQVVTQSYSGYDGYCPPAEVASFLNPLRENLGKLEETKKAIMPEVTFREKKFTYQSRHGVSVTYIYTICPVCRHICKV